MIVLLGQLLQGLLQTDALVSLVLKGLLPLLAVRLRQHQEVSAGLQGRAQVTATALYSTLPRKRCLRGVCSACVGRLQMPLIPTRGNAAPLWTNKSCRGIFKPLAVSQPPPQLKWPCSHPDDNSFWPVKTTSSL